MLYVMVMHRQAYAAESYPPAVDFRVKPHKTLLMQVRRTRQEVSPKPPLKFRVNLHMPGKQGSKAAELLRYQLSGPVSSEGIVIFERETLNSLMFEPYSIPSELNIPAEPMLQTGSAGASGEDPWLQLGWGPAWAIVTTTSYGSLDHVSCWKTALHVWCYTMWEP